MPLPVDISYDLNVAVAADVEPAVAADAGLRLMGWECREADGTPAAAAFNIVHGAAVSGGAKVVPVELAANESKGRWYGDGGLPFASGITIEHVAGTFEVTLFYKVVE